MLSLMTLLGALLQEPSASDLLQILPRLVHVVDADARFHGHRRASGPTFVDLNSLVSVVSATFSSVPKEAHLVARLGSRVRTASESEAVRCTGPAQARCEVVDDGVLIHFDSIGVLTSLMTVVATSISTDRRRDAAPATCTRRLVLRINKTASGWILGERRVIAMC